MSRTNAARHERSTKASDGADVAALARSVGLRGFSPEPEAAEQPSSPTPPTPSARTKAPDAADVAALARSVGLRGFRREGQE